MVYRLQHLWICARHVIVEALASTAHTKHTFKTNVCPSSPTRRAPQHQADASHTFGRCKPHARGGRNRRTSKTLPNQRIFQLFSNTTSATASGVRTSLSRISTCMILCGDRWFLDRLCRSRGTSLGMIDRRVFP